MTKREAIEWLIDNEVVACRSAERNRAVLRLRYVAGLTFEQIASELDISPITVSRIVHKHGDPLMIELAKMMSEN